MSTIVFDIVYASGHVAPIEYDAGSDRQLLHFLTSAINNSTDGIIQNVRIY